MKKSGANMQGVLTVPACCPSVHLPLPLQWAATRHDIFAHDVCDALEKLHTQAPAHSFR
jgi:hypothetical protein